MKDLVTAVAFLFMILSPCLVAMSTGIHEGSDLGRRDPAAAEDVDQDYIPQ